MSRSAAVLFPSLAFCCLVTLMVCMANHTAHAEPDSAQSHEGCDGTGEWGDDLGPVVEWLVQESRRSGHHFIIIDESRLPGIVFQLGNCRRVDYFLANLSEYRDEGEVSFPPSQSGAATRIVRREMSYQVQFPDGVDRGYFRLLSPGESTPLVNRQQISSNGTLYLSERDLGVEGLRLELYWTSNSQDRECSILLQPRQEDGKVLIRANHQRCA